MSQPEEQTVDVEADSFLPTPNAVPDKTGCFKSHKWKHFVLVSMFFAFKVALPTMDMITDALTAKDFFDNGHTNWGICTTLPIFAPFVAKVLLAFVRIGQCFNWRMNLTNECSFKIQMQELPKLLWDFPLLQPLRRLRQFNALLLMDTSLHSNFSLIRKIKSDAVESRILEAFLESTPQFILQFSIILRTGLMTVQQIMSLPFSFTSLALASIDIFYSLRHGIFSDNDPTLKMVLCVIPFTTLLVAGPLLALTLIATFFRGYFFVYIFVIIGVNSFVINKFYLSENDRNAIATLFQLYKVFEVNKETVSKSINYILLTAIFTSWVSPCAVWINNFEAKSYFLLVVGVVTMTCHSLGVASIYLAVQYGVDFGTLSQPIFNCFLKYNSSQKHGVLTEGGLIELCQTNCTPRLRLCSDDEDPRYLFFTQIGTTAFSLLLCSLLSAMALQYLGNFYNIYCWSKMFFKHPIIHKSLLQDYLKNSKNLQSSVKKKMDFVLTESLEHEETLFVFEEARDFRDENLFTLSIWHDDFHDLAKKILAINRKHNALKSVKAGLIRLLKIRNQFSKNAKIEEILNDLEFHDWPSAKQESSRVWKEPPLMRSIKNGQFGRTCLLHILGATFGAVDNNGITGLETLYHKLSDENDEIFDSHKLMSWYMAKFISDTDNVTLLHLSAKDGNSDMIKSLMRNSARVNKKDSGGWSPLHYATHFGQTELVKLLAQAGGNINEKDVDGVTPHHFAAGHGDSEVCKQLMLYGARINGKTADGWTPLFYATRNGHYQAAKLLLDEGAKIDEKDINGWTVLHWNAFYGYREIGKLLLRNGAEINQKAANGLTPLHLAAMNGHHDTVELLLKNGVNVHEKFVSGCTKIISSGGNTHIARAMMLFENDSLASAKTALDLAVAFGHNEVCQLLLHYWAKPNEISV